jgi:hypothetical protein
MEKTIFDYKISLEELKFLFIEQTTEEDYLKNTVAKRRLQDLYVLFKIRNNWKKVAKIGNRIFKKTVQAA